MYSLQAFEDKPVSLGAGFIFVKIRPLSYNQLIESLGFLKKPSFNLLLKYFNDPSDKIIDLVLACDGDFSWTNAVLKQSLTNEIPPWIPCKKIIAIIASFIIYKIYNKVILFSILSTINHLLVYFDNAIDTDYHMFSKEESKSSYDGEINAIENELVIFMTYAKNGLLGMMGDINFRNYKDKLSYPFISSLQRMGVLRYAQALNMPLGGGESKDKEYSTNLEKYIDIVELLIKSFITDGEMLGMDEWFGDDVEMRLSLRVGKAHWGNTEKSKQYLFFKKGYMR